MGIIQKKKFNMSKTDKKPDNLALKRVGLADTFAESGEYELLLEKYGMSANHIVQAVKDTIKRRK